jgi:dienelactone hydrolase
MKKFLLTIVSLLCALLVLFFSQIRLGFLTAFFLSDLLDESEVHVPDGGALSWVTAAPIVERLGIPGDAGTITADLYRVPDGEKRAAILLTHGIIESGKDDPRLVRSARSLARCGFVVLVPELKGMKSFRILLSDVDDIVDSFRYLASLKEIVDGEKVGLLGFSYGAGPTFIAAADPAIRGQVKFVVSFGGYYDPTNVIRYITTGYYEYGDEKGFQQPEPYGKWIFFMNNVNYVESARDRELLKAIFEKEEQMNREEAAPLIDDLTPRGRFLYKLLINEDPDRVDRLVKQTDPRFQRYLERLALARIVPSLQAYIIVGHGNTDPLIPYTESLRLADAVDNKAKVHVAILKLFTHVDPTRKRFSVGELITVYVPSLIKFYYLVYDLLRQQR